MPKAVTLIRSTSLSDTAEYAYAATAHRIAVDLPCRVGPAQRGRDYRRSGYAAQAAKRIENMTTALAEAGAGIDDVISTRVLVASSRQADLVPRGPWAVVRDAFGDHDAPSSLFGVTVLGYDHQLVEIEAIAAVRD